MHEMTLGFLKTALDNVPGVARPACLAFAPLTLPFLTLTLPGKAVSSKVWAAGELLTF